MSAELQRILASHDGGTLVIDASGTLRREP
jgi:hypothetical protein